MRTVQSMGARKGFATMSSRIEHPLGGSTGRTPRAERKSSYTADEAIAAKAEIDALVAEGFDSRTAAAMKGQITRKTVGYVSKPKQLLERMLREDKREYLDWMFDGLEQLADRCSSASAMVTAQLAASGMTLEELCERIGANGEIAKLVMATSNASSPVALAMPKATVFLPISRLEGVKDWLHDNEIELLDIQQEKLDGVHYGRFDFESEEDATLFRLRFL